MEYIYYEKKISLYPYLLFPYSCTLGPLEPIFLTKIKSLNDLPMKHRH